MLHDLSPQRTSSSVNTASSHLEPLEVAFDEFQSFAAIQNSKQAGVYHSCHFRKGADLKINKEEKKNSKKS
jgi:hypothetical protein